jgi:hypothetical protein
MFYPCISFLSWVSFHQCAMLIHLSTTDSLCFSPSTSDSHVSIIPSVLHTHSFIYHRCCIMFFSQCFSFLIPPMLHTHSFMYHRRCIKFFSQYFSFFCQYHSTNAAHSFSHLSPTLYNVFFPSSTLVSTDNIIPPMLHTHLHLNVALVRRRPGGCV